MKIDKIKTFYRRNLPHIQPVGASFFVTFRLKDSIPKFKLWELKKEIDAQVEIISNSDLIPQEKLMLIDQERKSHFAKYDALLDQIISGPTYLNQPEVAQLVVDQLHRFDNDLYQLVAYSIMPNHVHILIDTSIQFPLELKNVSWENLEFEPLQNIMRRIKGPSAIYANRLLNRSGKFWQKESYDRYVRDDQEFRRIIRYILNNPVKANLASSCEEHPFTWCR